MFSIISLDYNIAHNAKIEKNSFLANFYEYQVNLITGATGFIGNYVV